MQELQLPSKENKSILKVSDIDIDLIFKDIKNVHLSVYPPTGRVRLAAPLGTDVDALRLYVISKISWIRKNRRVFARQERISARTYEGRESHYFLGHRYLLEIVEYQDESKLARIEIKSNTYLTLYIKQKATQEEKQSVFDEWHRAELKKIITPMIEKWEQKIGVKVNAFAIQKMKTKWGSCKIEKANLLFNLELAKKPIYLIEYVVLHEMIHLLERHHNDYFFHLMQTYMPNWKAYRKELNALPLSE